MADTKSFKLPDLGEGLPDATIVEWAVKVGDTIRLDEPLVSMETAKAVVDVPSPVSGKVLRLAGAAGDVVETGAVLAEFEIDPDLPQRAEGQDTGHHHGPTPGKGVGAQDPAPDDRVVASSEGGAIEATDEPQPEAKSEPGARADSGTVVGAMQSSDAVLTEQASSVGGVKAMPAVRAMARKLKVDITRVRATGTDGVVTMADVKQAAADGSAAMGSARAAVHPLPPAAQRLGVMAMLRRRGHLLPRAGEGMPSSAPRCPPPASRCARSRRRCRPAASPSSSRACAATWRG